MNWKAVFDHACWVLLLVGGIHLVYHLTVRFRIEADWSLGRWSLILPVGFVAMGWLLSQPRKPLEEEWLKEDFGVALMKYHQNVIEVNGWWLAATLVMVLGYCRKISIDEIIAARKRAGKS